MNWFVNLESISIYWWLIIALVLGIGFYGSYEHKKLIPVIWGSIFAGILYFGYSVLEPLIFGFQYYAKYSMEYMFTLYLGIMFAVWLFEIFYNIIKNGVVVD